MVALAAAIAALAAGAPGAEATTPSLSSAEYDPRNTGTWAGTLKLTFNTPMQVHTSVADALADIQISKRSGSTNLVSPSSGSAIEFSGNNVNVFFGPAAEDQIRRIGTATLALSITGTALKSADTSTALAAYGGASNVLSANPSTESVPPSVVSATLDRDSRTLSLTTDESINYGKYVHQSEGSFRNYPTNVPDANITKYHVREGATATTGVNIATSNTRSVHGTPASEIRIVLTATQLATVLGYSNPHLYVDADAFSGIAASVEIDTTNNLAIVKQLNVLPYMSAAQLTTNTRALSVTFSETVTKSSGSFYIRNSATGAYNSGTDVAGTLSVSGTAGTATLTASQVSTVTAMSTPHLHLNAGAVTDSGSVGNNKSATALTVIVPKPTLSGSTLNETTGALVLTFDKNVKAGDSDVDQSKIHIRDGSGTTGGDPLTGATVTSTGNAGNQVTITLTSAQRTAVVGYSVPHIYLTAGAVKDTSDNANDASSSSSAIPVYPELGSAAVDLNNFAAGGTRHAGALALYFNTAVAAHTSEADTLSKITLREADNSPSLTLGAGASMDINSGVVSIGLSPAQKESVRAMSGNLEVLIGANAFKSANGSLALPAVGDGDLAIPSGSVAADTARPVITSAAINEGTGVVTYNFDESVKAGSADVNLGQTQIYTSGENNFPLTGSTVTSSGVSPTVTIEVTEPIRQNIIALSNPQFWFAGGAAISDTAGNFVASGTVGETTDTADSIAPALSSASINEGTGAWSVAFSETVSAGTATGTALYVRNTGGGAYDSSTDVALAVPSSAVSSSGTLSQADRQKVVAMATPTVYAVQNAVQDTSNNGNAAGNVSPNVDPDTIAPAISSAAINENTGAWSVVFSETVSAGTATGTVLYVRNSSGAYDSTTDVALTVTASSATSSGSLSETDRQKVIAMATPTVYAVPNAVQDTSSNGNAAGSAAASVVTDNTAPTISSAAINAETGAWSVTFSETVSAGTATGTVLYVRNAGGGAYDSTTDAALAVSSSTDTFSGTLSEADRQKVVAMVVAMNTPTVYAVQNAVQDTRSNGNAAGSAAASVDTDNTAPTLTAQALDEHSGVLTLTFNETVKAGSADVDLSKIHIRNGSGTTGGDPLTGATVTSTGNSAIVTITLTETQRQTAIGHATPHLRFDVGAVEDISGTDIAASSSSAPINAMQDNTAPTISSAAINENTSAWSVVFSETVSAGTATGTVLYVRNTGGGAYDSSTDVALAVTALSATSSGTLSETDRQKVIAMATPTVYAALNAVQDTRSNGNAAGSAAASVVTDNTAPAISSAAINENTSAWSVAFSETVSAGTATGTALYVRNTGGGAYDSSTDVALAVSSSTDTFSGALSEADRQKVIAMATPTVYAALNAVQDTRSNGNAAGSAAASVVTDNTAPAISSAAINENTGAWSVTFSETVSAGTATGTVLYVRNTGGGAYDSSTDVALAVTALSATSSGTLSETDRQKVIAMATPTVYAALNAVQDTRSNGNAAGSVAPSVDADTTAPTLTAQAFDEGGGVLTLTFSETVKADPANVGRANIYIRDGSGVSSDGTRLNDATVTSSGNSVAVTIELSEEKRQEVIGYGDPHLYFGTGIVQDTSSNNIAANTAGADISVTPDATAPALSSASINEGTGAWSVAFSETVSAGTATGTALYVRNTGGGAYDSSTDVALTAPSSAVSSTGTLSETDRQKVIAMATPTVYAALNAVQDTRSNGNAAGSVAPGVTPDSIAPTISSTAPALDEGDGTLVVEFSETVKASDADVNQSKIFINNGAFTTGGTALTGAAVSLSGNSSTVTITLTETQRQTAIGYATPHLRFDIGAVKDTSDQDIAASADSARIDDTPDATAPTVVSAVLDEIEGTLALSLDETVSAGSVEPARISIAKSGDASQSLALDASQRFSLVEVDGAATSVVFRMTEAQRVEALALAPQTAVLAGAAAGDTSGNPLAAQTLTTADKLSITQDQTPPSITSVSMDLDAGGPSVSVTFSESVRNLSAPSLSVAEKSPLTGTRALSQSAVLHDGGRLAVVPLTEPERTAVSGLSGDLQLVGASGAWEDAAGNATTGDSEDIDMRRISADTHPPVLQSASVSVSARTMSMTFGETVDVSEFDPIKITVTSSDNRSGTALSALSSTADGRTVILSLTESESGQMTRASQLSSPAGTVKVSFESGAWKDLSGNPNAEGALEGVSVSGVSAGLVALVHSNLDLRGAPVLELYFDGSLDLSSFDASQIDLKDGAGANRIDLSGAPLSQSTNSYSPSGSVPSTAASRVVLPLSLAQKITANAYSSAKLDADAGAWTSMGGVRNAPVVERAVDGIQKDTTGPWIASVHVAYGAGSSAGTRLVATFDEPVEASAFRQTPGTNTQNQGTFALKSNRVTYEGDATSTPYYTSQADADAVRSGDSACRTTSITYSNGTTHYHRLCTAVRSEIGVPLLPLTSGSSVTASPSSGHTRTMTFSLPNNAVNFITGSLIPGESDFEPVAGSSTLPLRLWVPRGVFSDVAGNASAGPQSILQPTVQYRVFANVGIFSATSAMPVSASLDLSVPSLTLRFDRNLSSLDPTKIYVGGPGSTSSSSLDGGTALSGTVTGPSVTPSSASSTAVISLTAAESSALESMTVSDGYPRLLYSDTGAWSTSVTGGGSSPNPIAMMPIAVPAGTETAGTAPALSSASLDLSASPAELALAFDKAVDVSEFRSYRLHVSTDASISADDASLFLPTTTAADGAAVSVPLTGAQRAAVQAMAGQLNLLYEAGTWQDAQGNVLASGGSEALSVTRDTAAPALSSAALDRGSGVLTLTFDEKVRLANGVSADALLVASTTQSSLTTTLAKSASSLATPGAQHSAGIEVRLTEAERSALNAFMTAPGAGVTVSLEAGYVSDPSGNASGAASAASVSDAPDTQAPLLLSATASTTDRTLTMVFDETIDVSMLDLTKFAISNIGETSTLALDDGGPLGDASLSPGQQDSPTVMLVLTEAMAEFAGEQRVPHMDIDAGGYHDAAGNSPGSAVHDVDLLVQRDSVPPELQSAKLDAHSGVLTLSFDDVIDAAPSYNVDLSDVYLSSPGAVNERSLSGAVLATSSDTDTLSVRLDEPSRRWAIDTGGGSDNSGNLQVDVSAGAFFDTFRNRMAAQADTAVAYSADSTAPRLLSASLDGQTGRLVLTFDETVKDPRPAQISISSATGVALADSSLRASGASVSGVLSEAERQAVVKKSGTLDVELGQGAVSDYAGVAVDARSKDLVSPLLAFAPDTSAPSLELAVLNLGARELSLTFSEPVWRVDLSGILVEGVAMTGAAAPMPATDSESVQITAIPEAAVASLVQLSDLGLDLAQGAVRDSSNNPVPAGQGLPLRTSADSTAPVPQSARFDEASGVLTIVFDESVRTPSPSMIRMSASLDGAQASASGDTVTVTLTEQMRVREAQAIGGSSSARVWLQEGAVLNLSAISVAASSVDAVVAKDASAPSLESGSLDLNDGTLVLRFGESVLVADMSGISAGGEQLGSANLSGDRTPTLTIRIPEAARQALVGQASVSVSIGAGAVSDASGNAAVLTAALQVTPDTTNPQILRAGVNLDTGTVRIVLDEWVDGSGIDASRMAVRGGGVQVTLGGAAQAEQDTVRVRLPAGDLEAVASVRTSVLELVVSGGAGIADTAGNALGDASPVLHIDDPIPPELVSARITGPSTVLLVFSEDLLDSSVSVSAFRVGQLAVTSAVETSGGRVLLTVQGLPEGEAQQVTALRTGVRDNSDNPLASDQTVSAPWRPALIDVVSLEMRSDGPNLHLAGPGDTISLVFSTSTGVSSITGAEVSIASRTTSTAVSKSGFTATYAVSAGDPNGPAEFSARVFNEAGSARTLSADDLQGPAVRIDTEAPTLETAMFAGPQSVMLVFSEPVLTGDNDYELTVDGSPVVPGAANSGIGVILLTWSGAVAADPASSSADLRVLASLTDVAGNPAAPAAVTVSGAQTEVSVAPLTPADVPGSADFAETGSSRAPVTSVPLSGTVRTVSFSSAGGPAVLAVDLSSLTDLGASQASALCSQDGRQSSPSCTGNTAVVGGLSVSVGGLVERIEFEPGTHVAGLPSDEQLRVSDAAARRAELALGDFADSDEALGHDVRFSRAVELGSPAADVLFSEPVRVVFERSALYAGTLVYTIDSGGAAAAVPECADVSDAASAKAHISGSEARACVDYGTSSVWTMHFTVFGVADPVRGGSECDDCTAPTLGYDSHGARLVDGGFAYNGLATDVEYFFTPYPLITSEVGAKNTLVLKIYENAGPGNVSHVSVAFGLRSGEVISESRAVINYDISHDGTGAVSVIDPEKSLDEPSASHETVSCSEGSELQCLRVTVDHSFRAPLEFDIVGTDVWDRERNSWQNYFNHGIRVTGESLNPVPGVRVNGGALVLYPIVEGSNNVDVMADERHALYRLSPDGEYKPLRNASSLFHRIDESMYTYDGAPKQGYDRSDPQFAALLEEQIVLARAVLEQMNLGRQGWQEGFDEVESSVHAAIDRMEALQSDLQRERERAAQTFMDMYGTTNRPE